MLIAELPQDDSRCPILRGGRGPVDVELVALGVQASRRRSGRDPSTDDALTS